MIYLTFDSNIWIYFLDDSWKEYSPLDHLEHWIEENHVRILLPGIIIDEWEKHKEIEKEKRKKSLKDFFSMADEIMPSAFLADHRKPENINRIIEYQFNRVDNIIKSKAEVIELTSKVKLKLVDWGIAKKAPLHKKSSVADAIIILSLFEYAESHPNEEYFFVSANTDDFYSKENKKYTIHEDLESEFLKLRIKECRDLNFLIHQLREKLPVTIDIDVLKRKRIKYQIQEEVYNPSIVQSLDSVQDAYIENTKHLDLIVKRAFPTKQEILFVLGIIKSNDSYRQYFYKKLTSSAWFPLLKKHGEFHYKNNPIPIKTTEGFHVPIWESLFYLEKLSLQFKERIEPELIEELISIIINVSKNPVDNYRTWYMFLKILLNIPNNYISVEVLQFIPVWLSGRFDTMIQSSEICEKLLPKFLSDSPSSSDIEKAETILKHLFEISKNKIDWVANWDHEGKKFVSKVHLHYVSDALVKRKLIVRIIRYCSVSVILNLGVTIKQLLLEYPNGINSVIKDKGETYEIKTIIDEANLIIYSKVSESKTIHSPTQVQNYESLSQDELKQNVVNAIRKHGIPYQQSDNYEDPYNRIYFALNNDLTSSFGYRGIKKLGDEYHNESVLEVFSLVFRDMLDEKSKQHTEEAISLLKTFCFDNNFRLPFFKRIAFYVISKNWNDAKSVFWELIGSKDGQLMFSSYKYQKELYELLNENQKAILDTEIVILQKIINDGPLDEINEQDERYQDYWKLRWFSALKEITPFRISYITLSKSLNITNKHYENLGEIRFRSGSSSPFSTEEISQKSNDEIINIIHTFKPKDRFEEHSIDGLAKAIGKAIEENPQKFSNEIGLYIDVYYFYIYHILNGFREAWKNKKLFNWDPVLEFCRSYISCKKFYSGKLLLQNDGWNADKDWVVGSIANLLTEGLQHDEPAFKIEHIPVVKEIIITLINNLLPVDDLKKTNMDYPTYSFNSTAGKVLRSLLDYSLFRARNCVNAEDINKWEPEIKLLFESTLSKKIIDGYILEGMYFQQFFFLDKEWIFTQVENNKKLENREWMAFLGGYFFGNPPFSLENYRLFYYHYKRAIDNQIEIKSAFDSGMIRHLVSFYFWGYENLKKKGLILNFLKNSKPKEILEFVSFISRQSGYYNSLEDKDKSKLENSIYQLWDYLGKKYEKSKDPEELSILEELTNFIVFVPILNHEFTEQILRSGKQLSKMHFNTRLIENLIRLKDVGSPISTALNLGVILSLIPFDNYFSDFVSQHLIDLVVFLYQNNQLEVANAFCNKLSSQGNEVLVPIYNEYNA